MGVHQGQPVVPAGTDLGEATAGTVLVHGRGATARSIADLGREVHADGMAFLAPQAAGNEWYPNSFLAPVEANEPNLSSALEAVGDVLAEFADAGIPTERVVLAGFSQGACLASEYAARHPDRYGGVVALSGGLIGPEGTDFEYAGSLEGTPAFLGCSDVDPHIPVERVHETAAVLEELEADVTERIYEGMAHTVNEDELGFVRELVAGLV